MATTPVRATAFILEDIYVRQDDHGRYALNDLHQAAGGEDRFQPSNWLRLEQTKGLVATISSSSDLRNYRPVESNQRTGTFVVRELVYAYAMWISPAFHLKVIGTFDALVTGKLSPSVQPAALVGRFTRLPLAQLTGLQDQAWKLIIRLKAETQPALRQSLYDQLVDVYNDMGKQAPPLAAIGSEAPAKEPAVSDFWSAYRLLTHTGVALNHSRNAQLIALNLKQMSQAARDRGIRIPSSPQLKTALRESRAPRFVDIRTVNSLVLGNSIHCWIFAAEGGAA